MKVSRGRSAPDVNRVHRKLKGLPFCGNEIVKAASAAGGRETLVVYELGIVFVRWRFPRSAASA